MARINLCFSGWINGVSVNSATNASGESVDTSSMTSEELVGKLVSGELFLSLKDHLNESDSEEIQLFDFDVNS